MSNFTQVGNKTDLSIQTLKNLFGNGVAVDVLTHSAIASNTIDGIRAITIRGQNPDIDIGSSPEIIGYGGGQYTFPTYEAPLTLNAVAGESYLCKLIGVDGNFDEIEETIHINGSSITTNSSFLRLNEFKVIEPGTKVADLEITHPESNKCKITIAAKAANLQYSMYTCPNGWSLCLTVLSVSVGKNKDADVEFRTFVNTPNGIIEDLSTILPVYEDTIIADFKNSYNPVLLPAQAAFTISGTTLVTNTRCSTYGSILLIRDDVLAAYTNSINESIQNIL